MKYSTWLKAISLFMIVISLGGCSRFAKLNEANVDMKLNRINSKNAKILNVTIEHKNNLIQVNGYLLKRDHRRGKIAGHLHIDVLDKDNKPLTSALSAYHRHNRKAQRSHFTSDLTINSDEAQIIRITHHRTGESHK